MPDYSNMFNKPHAVVGHTTTAPLLTVTELMGWRNDLSDKIREHLALIEKIVKDDFDVIVNAGTTLRSLTDAVCEFSEKRSGWVYRFITGMPADAEDLEKRVHADITRIELMLMSKGIKIDPFKVREIDQVVTQIDYFTKQLDKVIGELVEMKKKYSGDLEQDAIIQRIKTLTSQQQLIAISTAEIQQLAVDIRTRPQQAKDFLSTTIPLTRRLCLDVLKGTVKASELRKKNE